MVYIAGVSRTVDTGDTYFNEISKSSISGSVEAKRKIKRERLQSVEVYDGKPLDARIEHARWIVDCPNCNSAEFAFNDNLFFCSLCKNSDVEGKVRSVKTPKEKTTIELILSKRQIKNRHWLPGQTVKDLEDENILNAEVI